MNYYNEIDRNAVAWLRQLIADKLIPDGHVDERSIHDVRPKDLDGFTQVHFFCGIAGWPLALRLAGWPDDVPVFSGSCPCQPYSAAGKGKGDKDPRNLWPEMFRLVRECRPDVVFGEQVPAAIGHGWLDGISADLEGAGFAVGAIVLGAHSVGGPHIRQRLYWVADSASERRSRRSAGAAESRGWRGIEDGSIDGPCTYCGDATHWRPDCPAIRLANTNGGDTSHRNLQRGGEQRLQSEGAGTGRVGDSNSIGQDSLRGVSEGAGTNNERSALVRLEHAAGDGRIARRAESIRRGVASGCCDGGMGDTDNSRPQGRRIGGLRGTDELSPWAASVVIPCTDGKARRISSQPGDEPLAHGIPRDLGPLRDILERMGHSPKEVKRMLRRPRSLLAMAGRSRVGRLRGYGNAIVPQVAAEFIRAFMQS